MQQEFEHIIANNQGRIRYIASRYSSPEEFDDMYQEILLQLWRSYESFEGRAARETWVYKVALNTACTFVKGTIKQKSIRSSAAYQPTATSVPAQDSCQADILHQFMNQLNDTDASILMMYLDGLSSDDMAEVVGITGNAVRARLKRIKKQFEQQYIGE